MTKEIASYIKNLLGSDYIVGTNIFAGYAPINVSVDHMVIIDSGGAPNFYLTDAGAKTVQILAKSTDYHRAYAMAKAVFDAIHGKAGITLPVVDTAYYANTITAISFPQSLGQDDKGLFNISTNYVFQIKAA